MAKLPDIVLCPECDTDAKLVESLNEKGMFHVCCNKGTTKNHKACKLYIGYEENGKVVWFKGEKKAIDYWNRRAKEAIKK